MLDSFQGIERTDTFESWTRHHHRGKDNAIPLKQIRYPIATQIKGRHFLLVGLIFRETHYIGEEKITPLGFERLNRDFQMAGKPQIVMIQKCNPASCGILNSCVSGCRDAAICTVSKEPHRTMGHALLKLGNDPFRAIMRSIFDYDDFPTRVAL